MLHAEGLNLILTTFVPEDAPILCDADHDRGAIWVGSGKAHLWLRRAKARCIKSGNNLRGITALAADHNQHVSHRQLAT
jgi:hypothetical protein